MGVSAFGTTLTKGVTAIAELTNISGPGLSADTIDVTSHDSENTYREYKQGIRDGGEVSIEGNFTNEAGQAALVADFNDGSSDAYTITFPNAVTWNFNAIVTAVSTEAPFDDKLGFSATLKITGKPTLA